MKDNDGRLLELWRKSQEGSKKKRTREKFSETIRESSVLSVQVCVLVFFKKEVLSVLHLPISRSLALPQEFHLVNSRHLCDAEFGHHCSALFTHLWYSLSPVGLVQEIPLTLRGEKRLWLSRRRLKKNHF